MNVAADSNGGFSLFAQMNIHTYFSTPLEPVEAQFPAFTRFGAGEFVSLRIY